MRGFVEYVTDAIILTIILQVVSVVSFLKDQRLSCSTDSGWPFRLGLVVDLNSSNLCRLRCVDLLSAIQHSTETGHFISTPQGDSSTYCLLQNWQGLGLRESQEKINRRREQRRRR